MSCSSDSTSSENLSHQSSLRENKQGVLGKDLVIVNNVRPVSALSFHVKIFRRTWRSHTWQVLEYLWYPDQTRHLLLYLWSKWSLELTYTSHISICSFFYIYLICMILFSCIWIHSYLFLGLFWYSRGFSGKFLLGWPQGCYCSAPTCNMFLTEHKNWVLQWIHWHTGVAFLADATSPRYNSLLPSLGHLNSSWHATVHPAALYQQTSAIVQSIKEKFCCQSPIIFAAVVRKGGSRPCLFNEHSQQSQKLPALQPAAPPLCRASTAQVFATRLSRHSPCPVAIGSSFSRWVTGEGGCSHGPWKSCSYWFSRAFGDLT